MRCSRYEVAQLAAIVMCGTATGAIAQSPWPLAQAGSEFQESFASWLIGCLGLYGVLALLAGAVVFLGACFVVSFARRPAVIAAYLVFLLLPPLLGILGALAGIVSAFSVLARTAGEIKQSAICGALAEALVTPLTALMITLPSYGVIAIGLFVRTLRADGRPTPTGRKA